MRFCTKNRSKTIIVDMDPLGGDGALNGFFQSEYEFGIQIFHTCSPSARSCTSMTWQPVKYVGRPMWVSAKSPFLSSNIFFSLFVQHFFDFPFDVSHDADSGRCSVPEAFQDLEGWFGQPPPTDPFTFYQQDFKRTYVWTYQKGVLWFLLPAPLFPKGSIRRSSSFSSFVFYSLFFHWKSSSWKISDWLQHTVIFLWLPYFGVFVLFDFDSVSECEQLKSPYFPLYFLLSRPLWSNSKRINLNMWWKHW